MRYFAFSEVCSVKSADGLEDSALFEVLHGVVKRYRVHGFGKICLFGAAADIVDISRHFVKILVAEITKIDCHHLSVRKNCRH